MSLYVKDLYGSMDQQLEGALVPNSTNMNSGNLIQLLPGVTGGRTKRRGGNIAAAIPALTVLAMQQLYGKSRQNHKRSKRFRRFRRRTFRKR